MTLKWHILTDDHSYTMLFEGGTPLNNPPIETHANSSMFALIFWPHVTIFCIFSLHECLKWILEFNSKSLFWCQSRQIFEVRAIEQRHHEFQLIHMPPHQFWPRYHSDGLSHVHVRFEFFTKQICNENIKTLTQIHFPWDAHIFRTCTIFYRHYKGLHQMRKDLVLCALALQTFTRVLKDSRSVYTCKSQNCMCWRSWDQSWSQDQSSLEIKSLLGLGFDLGLGCQWLGLGLGLEP